MFIKIATSYPTLQAVGQETHGIKGALHGF